LRKQELSLQKLKSGKAKKARRPQEMGWVPFIVGSISDGCLWLQGFGMCAVWTPNA
jgi:hypothetical protein